jgi:hypothetical protein
LVADDGVMDLLFKHPVEAFTAQLRRQHLGGREGVLCPSTRWLLPAKVCAALCFLLSFALA